MEEEDRLKIFLKNKFEEGFPNEIENLNMVCNRRYLIDESDELFETYRQGKYLRLKKKMIRIDENFEIDPIEEETLEEMEEIERCERERMEFLCSEIEDFVPEKGSGIKVKNFSFKSKIIGFSFKGNLGGLIWREIGGLKFYKKKWVA